ARGRRPGPAGRTPGPAAARRRGCPGPHWPGAACRRPAGRPDPGVRRRSAGAFAKGGGGSRGCKGPRKLASMTDPLPTIRLRNAWRSSHPWIFQRLVEKPTQRVKPGSIVDIVGVDGAWIGRGFYNGHSRIALRILETDPDVAVDATWFARRIAEAVHLRREVLRLDDTSNAWRVVHSEGDGLSGLVVDRYDDLLVVEYFSAGMF